MYISQREQELLRFKIQYPNEILMHQTDCVLRGYQPIANGENLLLPGTVKKEHLTERQKKDMVSSILVLTLA